MTYSLNLSLDSANYCVEDAINYINEIIQKNSSKKFLIDISKFNFLEATNICVLSSTFLFTQNPDNKITWIVDNENTQKTINRLKLKNISLETKEDNYYNLSNLAEI